MIFFSCFGGWLDIGLLPNIFLINNFPANGSLPMWPFGIPSSNLFLLLYSSLPLQGGQIWIKVGVKGRTNEGLSYALGTGVLFLVLQLKEYTAVIIPTAAKSSSSNKIGFTKATPQRKVIFYDRVTATCTDFEGVITKVIYDQRINSSSIKTSVMETTIETRILKLGDLLIIKEE